MAKKTNTRSVARWTGLGLGALAGLGLGIASTYQLIATAPLAGVVMPVWLAGVSLGLSLVVCAGVIVAGVSLLTSPQNPVVLDREPEADLYEQLQDDSSEELAKMTKEKFLSSFTEIKKQLIADVETKNPAKLQHDVEYNAASIAQIDDNEQLKSAFRSFVSEALFGKAMDLDADNCAKYLVSVTPRL